MARATGASFHDRATARAAVGLGLVDIAFSRYNASHPNARHDYFPFIEYRPGVLNYNFKSAMPAGTKSRLLELGFPPGARLPDPADHYRFVLSRTAVDGILCSPSSPAEVDELAAALARGAVSPQEEEYMILLSRMVNRAVFA